MIITAASGCRFQSVKAPCSASTPKPCGRSLRPRRSAASTVSPHTRTFPARTASRASRSTCPRVRTRRKVRVPRSATDVSFRIATSCSGQRMVTSSRTLSRVSLTPLAPNSSVPPRRRTPGASVIIGIPRTTPSTSMAGARRWIASTSPAPVDTRVHVPGTTACDSCVVLIAPSRSRPSFAVRVARVPTRPTPASRPRRQSGHRWLRRPARHRMG